MRGFINMKVLKPVKFASSMLTSSTAVDTTPVYNSATTYAVNVVVQYQNNLYVSAADSNTNHTPGDVGSESWWVLKGPNNIYAMFDGQVSTQTSASSPFTVVLTPGTVVTTLALFNLSNVNTIAVSATSSSTQVFNKTYNLDSTSITDWFDYFFQEYELATELIVNSLPLYSDLVITVTLSGGSPLKVGSLVFGRLYEIGLTNYGASTGIRDYSIKRTDDFGNTTFVERPFSRRGNFNIQIDKENLNKVNRILEELRATPAVWIASEADEYQFSTIFGYYKDYNIEISYPSYSLCSLEIEGLI